MDLLHPHRSNWLESRPVPCLCCSKRPSTHSNTAGNRQTETAAHATGETDVSPGNVSCLVAYRVQFAAQAKGKVEAGVDFVQENALAGKQFASLAAQNLHLAHWEATVADTRIHGTTRQQVAKHFLEVEKPALRPLPASLFPCF